MRYFDVSIDGFEYLIGATDEEHARYILSNHFAEKNKGFVLPSYPVFFSEKELSKIKVKEITKEEFEAEAADD